MLLLPANKQFGKLRLKHQYESFTPLAEGIKVESILNINSCLNFQLVTRRSTYEIMYNQVHITMITETSAREVTHIGSR